MQCSRDVDGAVVKLRSGPVHEDSLRQRCSQEDEARERQESEEEAGAKEMQGNNEEDKAVEKHKLTRPRR